MEFNIKDKVKLKNPLSYLKTSDNMPMLRPPDLVACLLYTSDAADE